MSEGTGDRKSVLEAFGGVKGIAGMVTLLALVLGYSWWERRASGDALGAVAAELGLQLERGGRHSRLVGQIDGVGVSVRTVSERSGQDTRHFTDFRVYAPDGPPGRIVASTLRERTFGDVSDDERVLSGDAAFDDAVIVSGMPEEVITGLDATARAAIIAATDAGWSLEAFAWQARKSGRLTRAARIRELLDLGRAAEASLR